MQTHRHLRAAVILSAFSLQAFRLFSQQLPPPVLSGTAAPLAADTAAFTAGATAPIENRESKIQNPQDDEVVQLSVFNVTGSQDRGYEAMNTASGSRIKTALKDTAASIMPFTPEFLDDIGANTLDDIMAYSNVETEVDDTQNAMSGADSRGAGNGDNRFRIRGLPMTTVMDYTPISFSMNMYNVDRIEMSSGANSILFGIGAQGGAVIYSSKQASTQRNTLRVKNTFGAWTSPAVSGIPFYMGSIDYNIVLAPKKAALRLMGLYQDGSNQGWRQWVFNRDKRINPTLTLRPFKTTTINITYETGHSQQSTTYPWNVSDGHSAWDLLSPEDRIMTGFTAGANANPQFLTPSVTLPDGRTVQTIALVGTNPRFMLNDSNDTMYNLRQAWRSRNISNAGADPGASTNLRAPDDNSYYYNPVGPGGLRDQKFDRFQVVLEQRLGPVNLQLGYYHNKNTANARAPEGNDGIIYGDPNLYLSTPEWATGATGAASIVENPSRGGYYIDDYWWNRILNQRNDTLRATAEYTLNLKQLGRHRIIANLEHVDSEQYNDTRYEILVDENQAAAVYTSNPADGRNTLWRRHYVTLNDYSTYYASDWRIPVDPFYANDHLYHSTYVSSRQAGNHIKYATDSIGLALQSFMLKDKLVTTLGLRRDFLSFKREDISLLDNPDDPRILDKSHVLNEWVLNGRWKPTRRYQPYTFSAGAVYHITDRLSLFANASSNRGSPYTDGRATLTQTGVDPSTGNPVYAGDIPPPTEGRTLDYGIMLDPLGDGKINIRLTRFDTLMKNDATIYSGAGGNQLNNNLGANNLYNIFDALYFLQTTSMTSLPPDGGWAEGCGPGKGPMPAGTYAATPPDPAGQQPYGTPPMYNAGMTDQRTRGYELSITANFTKNLTMRLTGSYQQRSRTNIFNEILNYYNTNIPLWLAMADPNHNGGYNADRTAYAYTVNVAGLNNAPAGGAMSLYEFIRSQLYPVSNGQVVGTVGADNSLGGASVRTGLATQLLNQSGDMGNRRLKVNMTTSYKFTSGTLKGALLGGGVRYQSPNSMPDPNREGVTLTDVPASATDLALDPSVYTDEAKMIKGNTLLFWDAFAGYRFKLFGGRATVKLQLNVNNLFNQCVITKARVNAYNETTRVYLNAPRTFRLTATFDF